MRKFKFRAWDKVAKQWLWVTGIETAETSKSDGYTLEGIFHDGDFLGHEDIVVTQYTGLKDEKGKEIYEGDIVHVVHEDGYEVVSQVEWGLTSKWFGTYPAFAIAELESEMNSFSEIFDTGQYTIEVIGNIFENPELLESDKQ